MRVPSLTRGGAIGALAALVLMALPSPASASFPGANGKIFYAAEAGVYPDIWSMDPSGANQTDLTQSEPWDERPAVSPDGQTVAYASHVFLNDIGIYLMNADGSNQHRLIDDPEAVETDPAFTPNGANVLFTGSSGVSKQDVYTVPVTGGIPVDLTNNPELDMEPDACATNGKIVFVSARTSDDDIYVMEPNGSNQVDLTKVSGSQEIQPSWSPDCSHIVYVSSQNGGNQEIYVMEANGANQTRITSTAAFEDDPTWSPDGTKIAYASNSKVVIQAPTPGAPTTPIEVGKVAAEGAQPAWAPVPGSTPGGGGSGGGVTGGGGGEGASKKRPQTKIGAVHVHGRTAIVIFSGSLPSASAHSLSFKCKLDKGKFKSCKSPKKYKRLKPGSHRVQIEAISPAGVADPTPAKTKFRIHRQGS